VRLSRGGRLGVALILATLLGSLLLSFSVSQVKVQGAGTAVWTDKGDTASTTSNGNKQHIYSIHIDNISTLSNLIHLAGTASVTGYQGQFLSYQVQINWGDGIENIVDNSTINFSLENANNDFSGTWSSSPDHNYAAGGTYTIIVKLYHQNPQGAESGDATDNLSIQVITITSSQTGSGFVNVDNRAITTPHTFYWVVGSTHTLTALRRVAGPAGTRYVWTSWSDNGRINHDYIVPGASYTVTAIYKTQYYLPDTSNSKYVKYVIRLG
jgi:hypothetical protein